MNSKQRRTFLRKWAEQVKAARVYARMDEDMANYFFGETDLSISRYLQAWADGKMQKLVIADGWPEAKFFDTLTKRK